MKRIANLVCLCVVQCVSCLFASSSQEQDLPKIHFEDITIVVQLEQVQLSFVVRDSKGNFVRNLAVADFVLFENDKPRSISALREEETLRNAVIAVDTSWSIGSFLTNAVTTAVDFFNGLEAEDPAVVLFSEKPRVLLDWGEKRDDLEQELNSVATDGKTALYDSIIWIAENLFEDRSGKKVIILVTDGIDTLSRATFKEMMKLTRQTGVTLYVIIYTNEHIQTYREKIRLRRSSRIGSVSHDFHRFVISQNQFVEQVMRYGGRTIFSKAFADLHGVYGDIVREMRSRYVMLYQSDSNQDETRQVRIRTQRVPGRIFIDVTH